MEISSRRRRAGRPRACAPGRLHAGRPRRGTTARRDPDEGEEGSRARDTRSYNTSNAPVSATFTWHRTPPTVTVTPRAGMLSLSGSQFTDSFAAHEAHVYVIEGTLVYGCVRRRPDGVLVQGTVTVTAVATGGASASTSTRRRRTVRRSPGPERFGRVGHVGAGEWGRHTLAASVTGWRRRHGDGDDHRDDRQTVPGRAHRVDGHRGLWTASQPGAGGPAATSSFRFSGRPTA